MAFYTLDTLQNIWLAENINRRIPNNKSSITVQRPNNSLRLSQIVSDLIELDPVIINSINTTVNSNNIYTDNGTLTADRTLLGGGFDLTFNITSESDSSIQRWTPTLTDIIVSSGVTNAELTLTPALSTLKNIVSTNQSYISTSPTILTLHSESATANTSITLNPTEINLDFDASADLKLNGNAGSASQVLTSNGPGMPPTWTSVSGAGTVTANNGLTASGSTVIKLGGTLVEPTTVTGSVANTLKLLSTDGVSDSTDLDQSPTVLRLRKTAATNLTSLQLNDSSVSIYSTSATQASLIDAHASYIDFVSTRVNYRHTRNLNIEVVITDYTIEEGDQVIIIAPAPGASVTISLPASPEIGDTYVIKNKDLDGVMSVTLDGNGNTIDGVAALPYDVPYQSFDFIYDGTEWSVY